MPSERTAAGHLSWGGGVVLRPSELARVRWGPQGSGARVLTSDVQAASDSLFGPSNVEAEKRHKHELSKVRADSLDRRWAPQRRLRRRPWGAPRAMGVQRRPNRSARTSERILCFFCSSNPRISRRTARFLLRGPLPHETSPPRTSAGLSSDQNAEGNPAVATRSPPEPNKYSQSYD